MKFAFAAALVAAMSFAQDAVAVDGTEAVAMPMDEAKPQDNDGFQFFVERDGQEVVNLPQIPGIEFDAVSKDTVMNWAHAQEAAQQSLEQREEQNWISYLTAIQDPWNQWLNTQNGLKNEAIDHDTTTMEGVLNWAANSIKVEGKPLGEMVPIGEAIQQMKDDAEMEKQMTDMSQLEIHIPVQDESAPIAAIRRGNALFMDGCVDPPNGYRDWCQDDPNFNWDDAAWCWRAPWDVENCYWDCRGPPCNKTVAQENEEKLKEALNRYGLTEEGIGRWAEDLDRNWAELEARQEREQIAQAQADVASATDGAMRFLEGLAADARAAHEHSNGEIEAKLDQMRADLQQQTTETLANLDGALAELEEGLRAFAAASPEEIQAHMHGDHHDHHGEEWGPMENDTMPEPEPMPVEPIMLATDYAAEPETSNAGYYGIGAAALSTIAAAAYLYRKRQQKSQSDEFQRV